MSPTRRAGPGMVPVTLLVLASAWATAAEGPVATAAASKSEVKVGEAFVVEVTASGPEGTVWTFPEQAGSDAVEIRRAAPATDPEASASPPPHVGRYQAAVFALGEVELPAIPVKYRLRDGSEGEVSTPPLPLRIVSVLSKDPGEQKLADIHGPLALAIGPAFWIGLGALALLLLALAAWWRRRRRRAHAASPALARDLSPDAEAREALARLAASGLRERGDYRAFYIALTEIAKRYLERRLEAPILEMTSAEMVLFLRDHALGRGLTPVVRDLAAAADQVKFAAADARDEEARRHLAAVEQVVDSLEARLRPSPPATSEKVA
jgi:hypothetical protein